MGELTHEGKFEYVLNKTKISLQSENKKKFVASVNTIRNDSV
jgi:hypothetical protein